LAASAGTRWKIDVDVVVFGIDGFLNEWLVKDGTVDLNKVIRFHYVAFYHATTNQSHEKTC